MKAVQQNQAEIGVLSSSAFTRLLPDDVTCARTFNIAQLIGMNDNVITLRCC